MRNFENTEEFFYAINQEHQKLLDAGHREYVYLVSTPISKKGTVVVPDGRISLVPLMDMNNNSRLAAKVIAQGLSRLATKEEIDNYEAEQKKKRDESRVAPAPDGRAKIVFRDRPVTATA